MATTGYCPCCHATCTAEIRFEHVHYCLFAAKPVDTRFPPFPDGNVVTSRCEWCKAQALNGDPLVHRATCSHYCTTVKTVHRQQPIETERCHTCDARAFDGALLKHAPACGMGPLGVRVVRTYEIPGPRLEHRPIHDLPRAKCDCHACTQARAQERSR